MSILFIFNHYNNNYINDHAAITLTAHTLYHTLRIPALMSIVMFRVSFDIAANVACSM